MDKFITLYNNLSIWQLSKDGLLGLAEFVVFENYKHHQKEFIKNTEMNKEVLQIYSEELNCFEQSKIYVARNDQNETVGSIRIMKWNKEQEFFSSKIFMDKILNADDNEHFWHVGRFAVSSNLGIQGLNLFRVLMLYAIAPICKYDKGIMFAECDSKLFKIVRYLGMETIALSDGIEILGSLTIPTYTTRSGLTEFVLRNQSLVLEVESSLNCNEHAFEKWFPEMINNFHNANILI
jgi:hypothetical protein